MSIELYSCIMQFHLFSFFAKFLIHIKIELENFYQRHLRHCKIVQIAIDRIILKYSITSFISSLDNANIKWYKGNISGTDTYYAAQ